MSESDALTAFLRDVLLPYLAENQNNWDMAGALTIVNEETGRRRGTEAFRMRQRLEAILAGRPDPGPGPTIEQQK